MVDHVFKQYPKNGLEALVILRLLDFTTKVPFTKIDPESKNVKLALDYMVKSEFMRTSVSNLDISKALCNINRLKPKPTKNGICEYDRVLRSSHNLTTSKMYNRYCVSIGVFNHLKRIKSVAI
ncbi:hypothetical protein MACJ_003183 [Theileria orientalis]|uniref:Uncharacterized protein n=1 Tax=Theileria orientalis TaxID=68886 RepID=A0A976M901_THEOR|nr:hypothetical protein MACJ_003183 [Theileria orientalis]